MAASRLLAGVLILAIGGFWMTSIIRAGRRSSHIQRGTAATAVIDRRRFVNSCLHFTCDQTEYDVRYVGDGRVYRATVLADGWSHAHSPGSTITVVYDRGHPGRVEIAGHAPSRVLPAVGASIALFAGALIVASWSYVLLRERQSLDDGA